MRIFWIDPVNTDAQFMNMLTQLFVDRGHEVVVRSNRRCNYPVHPKVEWRDFSTVRPYPQRIDRHPLRYLVAAAYPFDWLRTVSWARGCGARAVLMTVSMRIRAVDIMAHRALRRAGLQTLVLAHKPHPGYFERHDASTAAAFRPFYDLASRVMVMTESTRELFADYFGLPADRILSTHLPHYREFMAHSAPDPALDAALKAWAGDAPVLAMMSNANAEHGFDNLLDCLPHLHERTPGCRLLCVQSNMSDRQSATLRERFTAAGFDPAALYVHGRPYSNDDLAAFLQAAWCVLTPYAWATQSSVIALAAGADRPVVATDVGGLSEMILPGVSGEIAPPGDPAALAEACARVLDPDRNPVYREGAREACAGILSPDTTCRDITEALADLGG